MEIVRSTSPVVSPVSRRRSFGSSRSWAVCCINVSAMSAVPADRGVAVVAVENDLRRHPAAHGVRFAPRERVLVRFADDPTLAHLRWVLSDHGDVIEDGVKKQKATVLTPDRKVFDVVLAAPKFSEVMLYGKFPPKGVSSKKMFTDKHTEKGRYTPDELEKYFVDYDGRDAQGRKVG